MIQLVLSEYTRGPEAFEKRALIMKWICVAYDLRYVVRFLATDVSCRKLFS